ncbi:hypothetical protein DRO66_02435 [Candidatus Bathyarchaeota archaeon]|nr:MAG: hypothetical protein DRO66_02435 [Candidatus Bathyarchaeota archaeon]
MNFGSVYKSVSKDYPAKPVVEFYDTGHSVINHICGGGFPAGRVVEFASEPGVGKTTIVLSACLGMVERGKNVLFIDSETSLNDSLLEGVGLYNHIGKGFAPHAANTWPEVQCILEQYLAKKKDGLDIHAVCLDSITNVLPTASVEADLEKIWVGRKSQLQGRFFEKYKARFADDGICTILINQARVKINMQNPKLSRPEGAGGFAMKHNVDVSIFLKKRNSKLIFDPATKEEIGAEVYLQSVKNKMAGSRVGEVVILYGKGIDEAVSLANFFVQTSGCERHGGWYTLDVPGWEGPAKVQGLHPVIEGIRANTAVVQKYLIDQGMLKGIDTGRVDGKIKKSSHKNKSKTPAPDAESPIKKSTPIQKESFEL